MARRWMKKYPQGRDTPGVPEPWLWDTLRYKGLEMVRYCEPYSTWAWEGRWELVFAKTGASLMLITTKSDLAAIRIATKIAELADWGSFETAPRWYSGVISEEVRTFMRTNREFLAAPEQSRVPYCTLADLRVELSGTDADWEPYVPYGRWTSAHT